MASFFERVMILAAKYDQRDGELIWNENLECFVICNDVFEWATADLEPVETDDDLQLLERCWQDEVKTGCLDWGGALYAIRRRKQRPQFKVLDRVNDSMRRLLEDAYTD